MYVPSLETWTRGLRRGWGRRYQDDDSTSNIAKNITTNLLAGWMIKLTIKLLHQVHRLRQYWRNSRKFIVGCLIMTMTMMLTAYLKRRTPLQLLIRAPKCSCLPTRAAKGPFERPSATWLLAPQTERLENKQLFFIGSPTHEKLLTPDARPYVCLDLTALILIRSSADDVSGWNTWNKLTGPNVPIPLNVKTCVLNPKRAQSSIRVSISRVNSRLSSRRSSNADCRGYERWYVLQLLALRWGFWATKVVPYTCWSSPGRTGPFRSALGQYEKRKWRWWRVLRLSFIS